jgi:hypothetical protein
MHHDGVLHLLTTEEFAEWFAALDDAAAEDVATALEVVEQLGPARAAPGSRESLLWYEHPSASRFEDPYSIAWDLEAWGGFRDYVSQILRQLQSPRFASRLSRLGPDQAALVLKSVKQIKRVTDPRTRWAMKWRGAALTRASTGPAEDACAEVRRLYFSALEAAGFEVKDVPAHSLALREFSRRLPAPGFRLLYGVNGERETALFVVGEWLDRSFYGDAVRRAERLWKEFLDGTLRAVEPAQFR